MVVWPTDSKLSRALSSKRSMAPLGVDIGIGPIFFRWFGLRYARTVSYVMEDNADGSEQCEGSEHGFEQPLPHRVSPGDLRIFRKVTVALGIGGVVEYVDNMRSAYRLRIVDAGVLPAEIVAQLFRALLGDEFHVDFGAELETAGRTCFDACWFETLANAVGAECALVNALSLGIEPRNIKRTTGHAEFAADTVFLVKVDDAVGVLHDGPIGGTSRQASGVGAVHALILAHQPPDCAIPVLVLTELD